MNSEYSISLASVTLPWDYLAELPLSTFPGKKSPLNGESRVSDYLDDTSKALAAIVFSVNIK